MANKNTNMILAVAVIAVCAIAIIGVGYAYIATTQNAGNDSSVKYITLSQGTDTASYSNAFDKTIIYDTANTNGTITYTLHTGVETKTINEQTAATLGTVNITVNKNTSNTDSFVFSVKNTVGTMDDTTFDYYIGIKVGAEGTEVIRLYEADVENFYKVVDEDQYAKAVTKNAASTIPVGTTTAISVTMYVVLAADPSAVENDKPLEGVTFVFKADAPDPTA